MQPSNVTSNTALVRGTEKINGLQFPMQREDFPVMFHPHSIPAHCVLMQNGPYVNLGCDPCQQNPSRLMESIDNIRLKRLVDLGSLPDCTCRDRPLVHVPPPSKFYNLLDSPATFSYCRLPPALP